MGVVMVIQDVTGHEQIEQDIEQRVQNLISSEIEGTQSAQD
jgi:hypothetical protein